MSPSKFQPFCVIFRGKYSYFSYIPQFPTSWSSSLEAALLLVSSKSRDSWCLLGQADIKKFPRYLVKIRYLENLGVFIFWFRPVFSSLSSWNNIRSSMPETIQFIKSLFHITKNVFLKWRILVTSICPNIFPQLLLLQDKFENYSLGNSKWCIFNKKNNLRVFRYI